MGQNWIWGDRGSKTQKTLDSINGCFLIRDSFALKAYLPEQHIWSVTLLDTLLGQNLQKYWLAIFLLFLHTDVTIFRSVSWAAKEIRNGVEICTHGRSFRLKSILKEHSPTILKFRIVLHINRMSKKEECKEITWKWRWIKKFNISFAKWLANWDNTRPYKLRLLRLLIIGALHMLHCTRSNITCCLYIFYAILEGQKHFLRSFYS